MKKTIWLLIFDLYKFKPDKTQKKKFMPLENESFLTKI